VPQDSRAAFADVFTGGAAASTELKDAAAYRLIVAPRVVKFTYAYNELKNLRFAIRPIVTAQLHIEVLDASGASRWQRDYDSGEVEGSSYMLDVSAPAAPAAAVTQPTNAPATPPAVPEVGPPPGQ